MSYYGLDWAAIEPFAQRVRLHLRRSLLYLKPWLVGKVPCKRGEVESEATIHQDSSGTEAQYDFHLLAQLDGPSYAKERRESLVWLTELLDRERHQHPLPIGVSPAERFEELQGRLELSPVEIDLCWLLLLPELSPDFLWMYRAIWGNPTQVASTAQFVQDTLDPFALVPPTIKDALDPQGPLRLLSLIVENPLMGGQFFRASSRFVHYLLGKDHIHPCGDIIPGLIGPNTHSQSAILANHHKPFLMIDAALTSSMTTGSWRNAASGSPMAGCTLIHIHGPAGVGRGALAAKASHKHGKGVLRLSLPSVLSSGVPVERTLMEARREAFLNNALLLLDGADVLVEENRPGIACQLRNFAATHCEPLFVNGMERIDSLYQVSQDVWDAEVRTPGAKEREVVWRQTLESRRLNLDHKSLDKLARAYNLVPGQIERATLQASHKASGGDGEVGVGSLVEAAKVQLTHSLSSVADRVEKFMTWDDLIVSDDCMRALHEIIRRHRFQAQVMDTMGFREKFAYGTGVSALFSGPPGTGKTMTAGVLARELDMELFRIDLSRIVSKWIGETEKNLATVFAEAKAAHAIILFDEADSLFGRRGEVKSSVDRYSNLEINYLLQRMENYDGISILTTNQVKSIDEAFMRRITFHVAFPEPDEATRLRLWLSMIPSAVNLEPDLDFPYLAEKFDFSGGHIKNAILNAAFMAAEVQSPITLRHFVIGALEEAKGMGKLIREEDLLNELESLEELKPRRKGGTATYLDA